MAKERILIVEDESLVAMDMETQLQDRGYEVVGLASSGEEAISKALSARPHVIIMDIMLNSKMDGIQAAKEIRKHMDCPVIFLTAYADEKILNRAKATEPGGYIVKPYVEESLHATIQMALSRVPREQQLKKESKWFSEGFNVIDYGIIITDPNNRISFMNKAAMQLVHCENQPVSGKTVSDVFQILSPDTHTAMDPPCIQATQRKKPASISKCFLTNTSLPKPIQISINAKPLLSESNLILGTVMGLTKTSEDEELNLNVLLAEPTAESFISPKSESSIDPNANTSPGTKAAAPNDGSSKPDFIVIREKIESCACEAEAYLTMFHDSMQQLNGRAFEYISEAALSVVREFLKDSKTLGAGESNHINSASNVFWVDEWTDKLLSALERSIKTLYTYIDTRRKSTEPSKHPAHLFDWSSTSYHLNILGNSEIPVQEIIELFLKDMPELIENLKSSLSSQLADRVFLHTYALTGASSTMEAFPITGLAILTAIAKLLKQQDAAETLFATLNEAYAELHYVLKSR